RCQTAHHRRDKQQKGNQQIHKQNLLLEKMKAVERRALRCRSEGFSFAGREREGKLCKLNSRFLAKTKRIPIFYYNMGKQGRKEGILTKTLLRGKEISFPQKTIQRSSCVYSQITV
ncbi:MAG: hypothetical protein IJP07_04955, partial [Firmicutes bacterium]|nr:hypothetical protein [Bacillota bacterium]